MPGTLKPLIRPHGLIEITKTFGDINKNIKQLKDGALTLDPAFERQNIVRIKLPYNFKLAWDHNKNISSIRCHLLLADRFQAIFDETLEQGLNSKANYFGGCFNFRQKRNGAGFSTHAWGIAIDLNPETNRYGTSGDMALEVVEIFRNFGFIWGGDWKGKMRDPMHFQYCDGY
jgi:hypothetical protein